MLPLTRRPLWRLFSPAEIASAARHAHRGGMAVVTKRIWYLFGKAKGLDDDLPVMTDWAIHAIKSPWYIYESKGPAKGLVRAPILKRWRAWAEEWADRDAAFRGSVHELEMDCTSCAACCFDNRVLLDRADLDRWNEAARPDLLEKTQPFRNRRRVLLVGEARACVHLQGLRCGVYLLRPNMCRDFVPGSEHCLAAREQKYGKALF